MTRQYKGNQDETRRDETKPDETDNLKHTMRQTFEQVRSTMIS